MTRVLDNWYNLWVRVKGPHNYMAMALDTCMKWPVGPFYTRTKSCGHKNLKALENQPNGHTVGNRITFLQLMGPEDLV